MSYFSVSYLSLLWSDQWTWTPCASLFRTLTSSTTSMFSLVPKKFRNVRLIQYLSQHNARGSLWLWRWLLLCLCYLKVQNILPFKGLPQKAKYILFYCSLVLYAFWEFSNHSVTRDPDQRVCHHSQSSGISFCRSLLDIDIGIGIYA